MQGLILLSRIVKDCQCITVKDYDISYDQSQSVTLGLGKLKFELTKK